jgi:hypothetical protein
LWSFQSCALRFEAAMPTFAQKLWRKLIDFFFCMQS